MILTYNEPPGRSALPPLADLAGTFGTYSPMMRFCLVDQKLRLFQTERMCFRGEDDKWIPVGPEGPLLSLVRKYAKHMGQESFYELD